MTNYTLTAPAVQVTQPSANAFAQLAAAGFQSELLPIIPPGARLSPTSNVKPEQCGKVPGIYHRAEDTWSGFRHWPSLQPEPAAIFYWHRWPGVGAGIQCRKIVALDFDFRDQGLADDCLAWCLEHLGPAPWRIGQAPKLLIPYRTAKNFQTRHLRWAGGGVDMLGYGAQFVASGIHPRTLLPYVWCGPALSFANLTPITLEQANGLEQWLIDKLGPPAQAQCGGPAQERAGVPEDFLPDNSQAWRKARLFLRHRYPAIQGQGGDAWTFKTACILGDIGLTEDAALWLMLREWNDRCEPPWPQWELRIKVESAYRSRRSPIGCDAGRPA